MVLCTIASKPLGTYIRSQAYTSRTFTDIALCLLEVIHNCFGSRVRH